MKITPIFTPETVFRAALAGMEETETTLEKVPFPTVETVHAAYLVGRSVSSLKVGLALLDAQREARLDALRAASAAIFKAAEADLKKEADSE